MRWFGFGPQSRQSTKLSLQSSELGGGTHSPACDGVGVGSQFQRGDRHCGTLGIYVCTLWFGPLRKCIYRPKEYWMIYRGPGFLVVKSFGSSPTCSPYYPVSKVSIFLSLPVCRRSSIVTWDGGGGGGGAKSCDRQKAWSSIYHSNGCSNKGLLVCKQQKVEKIYEISQLRNVLLVIYLFIYT
jgi:hypothetical protein